MRVPIVELRLVAASLAVLWLAVAAGVVVAYGAGDTARYVLAAAPLPPAFMAVLVALRPPVDRGVAIAVAASGIVAALLVVPIALFLWEEDARVGSLLLPSVEFAYAAVLAMLATCLFWTLSRAGGVKHSSSAARPDARRIRGAVLRAVAATALLSAASAGVVLATSTGPAGAAGSETGAAAPPGCGTPPVHPADATTRATAVVLVDGASSGNATMTGARSGTDERWEVEWSARGSGGRTSYVRIGERAWRTTAGAQAWLAVRPAGPVGWQYATLDDALRHAVAGSDARRASEDLGLELIADRPARHCRTALDAATAMDVMPALRPLVGRDPLDRSPVMEPWRGELDWWVLETGAIARAALSIGGLPGDDWAPTGLRGSLRAEIVIAVPGTPPSIAAPANIQPAAAP